MNKLIFLIILFLIPIVNATAPTQSIPYIGAELMTPLNENIVGYWKLNRYGSPDESKVFDPRVY